MGVGKKCAQACHASVSSSDLTREISKKVWKDWKNSGQKKIILKIQNLELIKEIYEKVKKKKIPCFLVQDAGLTQLDPGTITALGIGPALSSDIDTVTGDLKLL